jgi:hypothetical protein
VKGAHSLTSVNLYGLYVVLQLGEWNGVYCMCTAGAGSYIMFALKVSPVCMLNESKHAAIKNATKRF